LILVTGATGFVASALLPLLAARGAKLRCLVRAGSDPANLAGIDAERITGDLDDEAALRHALAGVERVFHLGALVSFRAGDRAALERINVGGTARLAALARAAGVRRFLHMSSVAAIGWSREPAIRDENAQFDQGGLDIPYATTKRGAELALAREIDRGLDAVIVNPVSMLGPGDRRKGEGSLLDAARRGRIPFLPPGGVALADVRDVAAGTLLAADHGRTGERYILGGENLTGAGMVELLCREAGVRPPRLALPSGVARAVGAAARAYERFRPLRPPLTAQILSLAPMFFWYSSAKAERELGYTHAPVAGAVRAALAAIA
jgi:dihydroflavonol-4-reductase